ncbi:MAG: porin family protein [Cryomorphaceae bacterium]
MYQTPHYRIAKTLTAIAVFFGSTLFAQDVSFNIHAGIGGSQVQGDGNGGFQKINLMAGVGLTKVFDDEWSMGAELNVAQKGSREGVDPDQNNFEEYSMALTYIQLPVYARYSTGEKLSFFLGGAVGYLLASQERDFFGDIESDPEFRSLEFSAVGGVRYQFIEKVSAELRFDQSVIPIRTRDAGSSAQLRGRQYNTVVGFYAFYHF